jgi:hypothetical protein
MTVGDQAVSIDACVAPELTVLEVVAKPAGVTE